MGAAAVPDSTQKDGDQHVKKASTPSGGGSQGYDVDDALFELISVIGDGSTEELNLQNGVSTLAFNLSLVATKNVEAGSYILDIDNLKVQCPGLTGAPLSKAQTQLTVDQVKVNNVDQNFTHTVQTATTANTALSQSEQQLIGPYGQAVIEFFAGMVGMIGGWAG